MRAARAAAFPAERSLALAALLCAAVYLPRLGAPFAWDDRPLIAQNTALDRPVPLSFFITRRYFEVSPEQSWRPISALSRTAFARAFGKRPAPLRALGLLLHAAAAALLMLLLLGEGLPRPTAALAAALFAVHPAHVEVLMCATFNFETFAAIGLLGMLTFHRRGRPGWAAFSFAFALLSKENAVLGLPAVLCADWALSRQTLRKRLPSYGAYAAVLAAYLWVQFAAIPGPRGAGGVSSFMPIGERLRFALTGLAFAARVLLVPVRLRLDYFAVPPVSWTERLLAPAAGLGVLALAAWGAARLWRRERLKALFLLWPFPFLALTSNIVPFDILSLRLLTERWLYVPFLGSAAFLACLLARRRVWAVLLMASWAALGALRARDWSRESLLWGGMVRLYPWSASAREGLGEALVREGRPAEALTQLQESLRLREGGGDRIMAHYLPMRPDGALRRESPGLRRWLAHACAALGDLGCAQRHMTRAVELEPLDGFSYILMTYSYARAGDFRSARAWLRRGLRARPDEPLLLRLRPEVEAGRLRTKIRFD